MPHNTAQASDYAFNLLRYLTLFGLLGTILIPIAFVISVSFRPPEEFFTAGVYLIPKNPSLKAWEQALKFLIEPLKNSLLIASGTTIVSMIIAVPGAYVFGRKDFPGKDIIYYALFVSLLFPHILLIVPITDIWFEIKLYNTVIGMWLALQIFVIPFMIYILRDYFEKLPKNLEEAAQIYGCTEFTAFVRVVLPIAMPAVVAVAFLAFLIGWNEFLFANMLTSGQGPRPAIVELFLLTQGTSGNVYWGRLMAITLILGTPPTVLYLFARSYLGQAFNIT